MSVEHIIHVQSEGYQEPYNRIGFQSPSQLSPSSNWEHFNFVYYVLTHCANLPIWKIRKIEQFMKKKILSWFSQLGEHFNFVYYVLTHCANLPIWKIRKIEQFMKKKILSWFSQLGEHFNFVYYVLTNCANLPIWKIRKIE